MNTVRVRRLLVGTWYEEAYDLLIVGAKIGAAEEVRGIWNLKHIKELLARGGGSPQPRCY
ncbi:MAG: hypothetical protein ABI651_09380 [Verrucomicrobiota bacterium]